MFIKPVLEILTDQKKKKQQNEFYEKQVPWFIPFFGSSSSLQAPNKKKLKERKTKALFGCRQDHIIQITDRIFPAGFQQSSVMRFLGNKTNP